MKRIRFRHYYLTRHAPIVAMTFEYWRWHSYVVLPRESTPIEYVAVLGYN